MTDLRSGYKHSAPLEQVNCDGLSGYKHSAPLERVLIRNAYRNITAHHLSSLRSTFRSWSLPKIQDCLCESISASKTFAKDSRR